MVFSHGEGVNPTRNLTTARNRTKWTVVGDRALPRAASAMLTIRRPGYSEVDNISGLAFMMREVE
jgi:hypothetical protein